jgi:short-subunit dehydrogenase
MSVDLSKQDGPPRLLGAMQQLGIQVQFLVNDAGMGVGESARETDLCDNLAVIQLKVVSVMHLTKLFAKPMAEHGSGRILITSSLAARAVSLNPTVYSVTKAFSQPVWLPMPARWPNAIAESRTGTGPSDL